MGVLRLILAIAVLIGHIGPVLGITIIDPLVAVESFFIISGFFMFMVLTEKYSDKPYRLFITNRFMRIYPIYWAVLILTVVLSGASFFLFGRAVRLEAYINSGSCLNIFSTLFLTVSNVIIFGQDLVMFMGIDKHNGMLFFTNHFRNSDPQLFSFLLVPQAWVLSIMLLFYLIVPFLARLRTKVLFLIIVISFAMRFLMYAKGYNYDPWTYRFLPFELAFFLAGGMAYKILRRVGSKVLRSRVLFLVYFIIIAFTIFYRIVPTMYIKQYCYYILLTFSLPFIFILTKRNNIDRFLGELSYPVFISHMFIGVFFQHFLKGRSYLGLVTLLSTIVFSLILIKIVKPIDNFRKKRALVRV